jgi:hypothetical protein
MHVGAAHDQLRASTASPCLVPVKASCLSATEDIFILYTSCESLGESGSKGQALAGWLDKATGVGGAQQGGERHQGL